MIEHFLHRLRGVSKVAVLTYCKRARLGGGIKEKRVPGCAKQAQITVVRRGRA
jgi:hypothetical protein